MTTPCYYCEIGCPNNCKACIHSDTYEEPKQTKPLSDEEIKTLHEQTSWFGISDPIKFARAIEERHGIK